jgi:hypothetical protein
VFTLSSPAKVSAVDALAGGVSLGIECGASCSVAVAAVSTPIGATPISVYGSSVAHAAAGHRAEVTLKMNSAGRAWLHSHASTSLRIAARDAQGAVIWKTIHITHASARRKAPDASRLRHWQYRAQKVIASSMKALLEDVAV